MRTYGWKADLPDKRDRYLKLDHVDASKLPAVDSHRSKMPPIWNQGSIGACTYFAIGGAFSYERRLLGEDFLPAFLQGYYFERLMEGTELIDAGAFIRDGMKVGAQIGIARGELWPYIESRFAVRPPKSVLDDAIKNRITSYARVRRNINDIRATLAGGDTIVFGISVYESFESDRVARTGMVPLPAAHEVLLGGHAVLGMGYDDRRQLIECRNSWDSDWGDDGYFWLPYEYVLDPDLSDDFWTLKTVTQPSAA